MQSSLGSPLVFTREERIRKFGIDCGESLHWEPGWKPGGDHGKKFHLRNVTNDVLKIKYKLPASKYFYMEYPEVVSIPPGMTHAVSVHFRPIVLQNYEDEVEFWTSQGTFRLSVRATIPTLTVTCDPARALSFGLVTVGHVEQRVIKMRNEGLLPAVFHWQYEETDTVEFRPKRGTLLPGQSVSVHVYFAPKEAQSLSLQAHCSLVDGSGSTSSAASQSISMHVTALAKMCYVSVSESQLEFGAVLTSHMLEKTVKVTNHSEVPATIFLRPYDRNPTTNTSIEPTLHLSLEGSPYAQYQQQTAWRQQQAAMNWCRSTLKTFRVKPPYAVLQPGQSAQLQVQFRPQISGENVLEAFAVCTLGGNIAALRCRGLAVGPELYLSDQVLYFGDASVGQSVIRQLILYNCSNTPLHYQLFGDAVGSFHVIQTGAASLSATSASSSLSQQKSPLSPSRALVSASSSASTASSSPLLDPTTVVFNHSSGVVPALLSVSLTLVFRPNAPINYYQRLFVLVQNQAPRYVDLVGTGCPVQESLAVSDGHSLSQDVGSMSRPAPLLPRHVSLYRKRIYALPYTRRLAPKQLLDFRRA